MPDNELTLADLAKELDTYSTQISTQLRTVNLGTLGLTWLLLLKKDEVSAIADRISERALFAVALACVGALLVDFLQYLFAEKAVDDAYERAAASETKTAGYDDASFPYRAQLWCYRVKLVLTFAATGALLILLGYGLA